MDYFELTKDKPLYLYGAASIGKIMYEKNTSLNICGFLDARAEEINRFMGLPVYTVEQAGKLLSKDVIIVLSVKNVFEHEAIAGSLFEAGFSNIIYKPAAVLNGRGNDGGMKLSQTWDLLLEGSFCEGEMQLPSFQESICYDFVDEAILSCKKDEVLAYIPIELIYTNKREDKWSDINIQGYYPHMYFFYYLSNHKNGQVEDYLKFAEGTALVQGDIKITDNWRKNVLRNRTLIYEQMRLSMDVDPQFFERNAPGAVWNEKGYFNLTSGKHRCAFLVSQGYRYILLKLGKDDYNRFFNDEKAKAIRGRIEKENMRRISAKVYHPWFYRFPCVEYPYYSFFQIEALCRIIKLSHVYGRNINLYTNLPEDNSLYCILKQCRLANLTEWDKIECADIILEDESYDSLPENRANKELFHGLFWHIGAESSGNVIAEYYFSDGAVYFWEETAGI